MLSLGELVPIIVIPSLCLMFAWLSWVLTRTHHLKVKSRIEIYNRLVGNITSAQDVLQLMESDDGRRLLESIYEERPTTMEEIIRSVRTGTVLTAVGMGGLLLRWIFPAGYGVFIVGSVLLGVVGVGLLISSIAVYHLSKNWGLIAKTRSDTADDVPNTSLFL